MTSSKDMMQRLADAATAFCGRRVSAVSVDPPVFGGGRWIWTAEVFDADLLWSAGSGRSADEAWNRCLENYLRSPPDFAPASLRAASAEELSLKLAVAEGEAG